MKPLLQHVTTPNVMDQELRRQGRLVIIVAAALTALALVFLVISLSDGQLSFIDGISLANALIYIGCMLGARYGHVRPAAYIIVWAPCLAALASLLSSPNSLSIFFLTIPILLASLVLPSRQMLPVFLVSVATVLLRGPVGEPADRTFFPAVFFGLTMTGLAFLGAQSSERALRSDHEARQALQRANEGLNRLNSELEERVALRTVDLQHSFTQLKQRESDLQTVLDDLRSSQDTIRELSAPILPVASGVLVAPLIGVVDSARASTLMGSILAAVAQEQARFLILDVTGVPVIDTEVGRVLLQIASALRLLGARAILTGIRPEVAQTLVGLGVDLGEVLTRSTLQNGIVEALSHSSAGSRSRLNGGVSIPDQARQPTLLNAHSDAPER
jgi:rsbT co-antagonist protein RsbR